MTLNNERLRLRNWGYFRIYRHALYYSKQKEVVWGQLLFFKFSGGRSLSMESLPLTWEILSKADRKWSCRSTTSFLHFQTKSHMQKLVFLLLVLFLVKFSKFSFGVPAEKNWENVRERNEVLLFAGGSTLST